MNRYLLTMAIALACPATFAAEVTVKNDSLTDGGIGFIVGDFAIGEAAAAWLTSPCNGDIRAAQVFWRSAGGGEPISIEDSITIFRSGTFPIPGVAAQVISGPVLTDGVINEYRYLDENNTIPLIVPVTQNETFVVSFKFLNPTIVSTGTPSVVRDNGNQAGKNALLADLGGNLVWFNSSTLGVTGDWVIRAVVDCQAVPSNADVSVLMSAVPPLYTPGAALTYTITISNAGPAASANNSIVDIFPSGYTASTWTCAATGGASCTSGGSGNITQSVSLPASTQVVYTVNGSVDVGATGTLSNSATAVVGAPANDPDGSNNTATLQTAPLSDRIFASGFES